MNQSGRDAASSPDTSVRSRVSVTVQGGRGALELRQPQVDRLADDVQELDPVAGRGPGRGEGGAVVRDPQELLAVPGIEDDDIGPECGGPVAAKNWPFGEKDGCM